MRTLVVSLVWVAVLGLFWAVRCGAARGREQPLAPPAAPAPAPAAGLVTPAATEAGAGLREAAPSSPAETGRVQWADDAARSRRVSGRVRLPDGSPARSALVVYGYCLDGHAQVASARTRDDGRFELEVWDPGARGDLLAYEHGHGHAPVARTDVVAGTQGLELELGPPAYLRLEVRDPGGRVLEQELADAPPTFTWLLAGCVRWGSPNAPLRRGEPPRLGAPPLPFFVQLELPGYRPKTVGPLDPRATGAWLVIEVEPLPRVRGRVRHAGAPVVGAQVELRPVPGEPPAARGPDGLERATTDTDGRFELVQPRAGTFELAAHAVPAGSGRLGPLDLDGEHDLEGLVLELTQALGSLEGHVVFPPGHGAREIWLGTELGNRSLRADGSFLFPDLDPGPFEVRVLEAPRFAGELPEDAWVTISHEPSQAPDWLVGAPTYTVEVRPGARARLVIDLWTPVECRLAGRVRIDGAPPPTRTPGSGAFDEPPQAVLGRGSRATLPSSTDPSSTDLDAEGAFALTAHGPGEYRLELTLALESETHERWSVFERVALTPGVVPWQLELATGSLRVTRASGEPLPGLRACWRGPGGVEVVVRYPELDPATGQALFRRVPAGSVRLELGGSGAGQALECLVEAGRLNEARWP